MPSSSDAPRLFPLRGPSDGILVEVSARVDACPLLTSVRKKEPPVCLTDPGESIECARGVC